MWHGSVDDTSELAVFLCDFGSAGEIADREPVAGTRRRTGRGSRTRCCGWWEKTGRGEFAAEQTEEAALLGVVIMDPEERRMRVHEIRVEIFLRVGSVLAHTVRFFFTAEHISNVGQYRCFAGSDAAGKAGCGPSCGQIASRRVGRDGSGAMQWELASDNVNLGRGPGTTSTDGGGSSAVRAARSAYAFGSTR